LCNRRRCDSYCATDGDAIPIVQPTAMRFLVQPTAMRFLVQPTFDAIPCATDGD
jgi:hypothetical protein